MKRYANKSDSILRLAGAPLSDVIGLASGFTLPELLPDASSEAAIAASQYRTETMQYSQTLGLDEMRHFVVDFAARDGVACRRENVLIVNGAKHGLDLVRRVFIEPSDAVNVTRATYMMALKTLRAFRVEWVIAGQDENGIDVAALEDHLLRMKGAGMSMPKFLYNMPDSHNPTGVTTH